MTSLNPMRQTHRLALVASLLAAVAQVPAQAQTREEITRVPVAPVPQNLPRSITVEDGLERAPCPLAGPQFADVQVTLDRADFGALEHLPAGLLDSAARPWLGQRIPISTLCEIRDRAAAILRTKGYLAAVRLPPQTIDSGAVRFEVLMARITGFQVRGNAGRAEGLIAGYLDAIRNQPVFNLLEAERYLLLARDIPGYDVRMTLRPAGTGQGEVIGEVMVTHTPVMVDANVQNYGSKATGRIGGLVQARFNGLLLPGDQTRIAWYGTADFKEQHVLQVGEQVQIGREGLTLSADFVHAWTRPAIAPGVDLRSKTWVATLAARYPLVRRQARNLALGGGFEAVNQDITVGGLPLSMDKLRVGFVRADFDALDPASLTSAGGFSFAEPRWRLNGSVELRQGLSVLGASEDCGPGLARCRLPGVVPPSRLEAAPTAFVARAQISGEVRLLPVLGFQLSARGQYAKKPLLSFEEFSAGNFTVGRGFDPGIIAGDSGLGLSGELRYGRLVPDNDRAMAWQAYGFVDQAWVWNRDLARVIGFREKLTSAGGGVRLAWGDKMLLDAGLAVPLSRTGGQTKRDDVRLMLNLTARLVPWNRR